MPTYEYTCQKCGHQFECVQSMSAKPLEVCPKDVCPRSRWGKGAVKRGIGGGAGLIFKGSGFYITDYRSEGYKAAAKADSSGGTPKASSDSGASKPASAPKPTPPAASPAKPKGGTASK